jgi:hypothetical protein
MVTKKTKLEEDETEMKNKKVKTKKIVRKTKLLREWCKECCFRRYGDRYLISKETSPTVIQCLDCMYKLLQYGKIEVTKPKNWNMHEE